jgi:TM2 domain-containing membrane protein YozV
MKSKTVAALLALFLGGIGIHRFYLNQSMLGILHLLFCWTFIPAVIGLFNGIVYLTMDEDVFNEKYNKGKVASRGVNIAEELEKLHELKEKGIITEEEFQLRKKRLI